MARRPENTLSKAHVTLAEFGAPSQWGEHGYVHPRLGEVKGKVFLREPLGLTGMEVSLNALPPGGASSFLHAHKQNEELYLFLEGQGEFQVDGEVFPVGPGSTLRVAPEGMRAWRSTGSTPLVWMVVQAKAGSLEQATAQDGFLGEGAPVW
jgi:mannose-6-phosphate isomerase-like protein (cupin superfamily)